MKFECKYCAILMVLLLAISKPPEASGIAGLSNGRNTAYSISKELPPKIRTKIDFVFVVPESGNTNNYSKAWTQQERTLVADTLSAICKRAPGLQARVTAYMPVRLQRCSKLWTKSDAAVLAFQANNSIYFSDRAFATKPTQLLSSVLHELTHLADFGYHLSCSDAWANACKSRMQKLNGRLSLISSSNDREKEMTSGETKGKQLAIAAGLPELSAAFNEQECLASCLQNYLQGYDPPAEIKNYLDAELLSLPYRPRTDLKLMYAAIRAETPEQSINLLNALLAKESSIRGYAIWTRAGCYAKLRSYRQAISDFAEAVKCFYNSPGIQDAVYKRFLETCAEASAYANSPKDHPFE